MDSRTNQYLWSDWWLGLFPMFIFQKGGVEQKTLSSLLFFTFILFLFPGILYPGSYIDGRRRECGIELDLQFYRYKNPKKLYHDIYRPRVIKIQSSGDYMNIIRIEEEALGACINS